MVPRLDVEHDARAELGAQRNLLLAHLHQLRAVRPPGQAPVLCQACSAHAAQNFINPLGILPTH
jgi:hypothetical protein